MSRTHRCLTNISHSTIVRQLLAAVALQLLCFSLPQPSYASESFCPDGSNANPAVIFCDDFEDSTALVRPGRYFEYGNPGNFNIVNGTGFNGSRGMRTLWQPSQVDGGSLKLAFGRNPGNGMNNGIRTTENFREIYYRMYLKMQSGWTGDPAKLSRATSIVAPDWSQAMIAHLWGDGNNHLLIDPARCVDTVTSVPTCVAYNDFAHISWLGSVTGNTAVFSTGNANKWFCIEHHVKLNDPGQANGVQEFWINGKLEARRADLNFVASYTDYGINAVFFENWWNSGSPQQQERYFDNIVVSTQPIGCLSGSSVVPNAPTGMMVQ
jgi:hypothetical protein